MSTRTSRTAHRFRRLALLVGLATLLTVAVAWIAVLVPQPNATTWIASDLIDFGSETREAPPRVHQTHSRLVPAQFPTANRAYSGTAGIGLDIYTIRTLASGTHHVHMTALLVGWPAPALWGTHSYYVNEAEDVLTETQAGILFTMTEGGWFPYRPIWLGFLANVALYTAVLWLIFHGALLFRQTIRRRRGQCLACGYFVQDSLTCPECGARRDASPHVRFEDNLQ